MSALNKSDGLSQWLRQESIDNLQWKFDDCRNDLSLKNKWRTIDKLQKEKLPKIWKLLKDKWRTIDKLPKNLTIAEIVYHCTKLQKNLPKSCCGGNGVS